MATSEVQVSTAYGGLPSVNSIPSNAFSLMSKTSSAPECFIGQGFSNKLQAYLVGYTNSVMSNYAQYSL